MTKINGFVGMIVLASMAMLDGCTITNFINVPGILIVGGLTFFGLMASGHKIIAAVSAITDKHASEDQLYDASETFHTAGRLSVAAGLLGVLIGVVIMLGVLDDPAAIGPSMAIALLTALYGTLCKYFIFGPISTGLDKRAVDIYSKRGENSGT